MNAWTQPDFEELEMNAEIGAYQPDFDDEREPPPVVRPRRAPQRDAGAPARQAADHRAAGGSRVV